MTYKESLDIDVKNKVYDKQGIKVEIDNPEFEEKYLQDLKTIKKSNIHLDFDLFKIIFKSIK